MSPWGTGQRVPMTFLGGYLGAGKTTVVNEVLGRAGGRRIAVLVNDVGTVGVDAGLVAARHGDTVELTNGCVCCSLVDGFAVALETLRERPAPPDHVLVELSGVAEPARVTPWAFTPGFRPDGVVVAADADQVVARAADPRLGELVAAQLAAADLVLVTKTDLVEDRTAVDALLDRHTAAPRLDVVGGRVAVELLLGPHPDPQVAEERAEDPGGGRGALAGHVADHVEVPAVTPDQLRAAVAALPADIVRAKGVVATTAGAHLVQRVGHRVRIDDAGDRDTGPLVLVGLSAAAVREAVAALRAAGTTAP